ncbi:SLATT domain-containing protein [Streptomyces sp. NRRL S-646]|uniref:SLATT domain-containing protein n=1 Tax=Streptomyces sp. NRRL S-646 TaxID=1463917 RepID=UPI000691933E|nr:SLATT domain-containing protein [Streptomyces sp. NRRL S-646]
MNTGGGAAAAEEIWRAQSIRSQAAGRHKAVIGLARTTALVAAGVLGAASVQVMLLAPQVGPGSAFLALMAAGAAPLMARCRQTVGRDAELGGYDRPKAEEMAGRARPVERWEQVLAAVSVVLGAVAGAIEAEQTAGWIPVVAAVSAVVISHGPSARHMAQQVEFRRTASEPERPSPWWKPCDPVTDADADQLAERQEHVVSVQSESWMAKWIADRRRGEGGQGVHQPQHQFG